MVDDLGHAMTVLPQQIYPVTFWQWLCGRQCRPFG